MEAKNNYNLSDLEVKSVSGTMRFYTPHLNTLYPIWFAWVAKKGVLVSGWDFGTTRDINVGTTKVIGFTTGVYTYIDNDKYVEIELTPDAIPQKYNNRALGQKVRTKAIKDFYEDGRRRDEVFLLDIPTTCFVKEEDVNFITTTGILYDMIDYIPIDKFIGIEQIIEVSNTTFPKPETDKQKNDTNSNSEKNNKISPLLALGLLLLLKT